MPRPGSAGPHAPTTASAASTGPTSAPSSSATDVRRSSLDAAPMDTSSATRPSPSAGPTGPSLSGGAPGARDAATDAELGTLAPNSAAATTEFGAKCRARRVDRRREYSQYRGARPPDARRTVGRRGTSGSGRGGTPDRSLRRGWADHGAVRRGARRIVDRPGTALRWAPAAGQRRPTHAGATDVPIPRDADRPDRTGPPLGRTDVRGGCRRRPRIPLRPATRLRGPAVCCTDVAGPSPPGRPAEPPARRRAGALTAARRRRRPPRMRRRRHGVSRNGPAGGTSLGTSSPSGTAGTADSAPTTTAAVRGAAAPPSSGRPRPAGIGDVGHRRVSASSSRTAGTSPAASTSGSSAQSGASSAASSTGISAVTSADGRRVCPSRRHPARRHVWRRRLAIAVGLWVAVRGRVQRRRRHPPPARPGRRARPGGYGRVGVGDASASATGGSGRGGTAARAAPRRPPDGRSGTGPRRRRQVAGPPATSGATGSPVAMGARRASGSSAASHSRRPGGLRARSVTGASAGADGWSSDGPRALLLRRGGCPGPVTGVRVITARARRGSAWASRGSTCADPSVRSIRGRRPSVTTGAATHRRRVPRPRTRRRTGRRLAREPVDSVGRQHPTPREPRGIGRLGSRSSPSSDGTRGPANLSTRRHAQPRELRRQPAHAARRTRPAAGTRSPRIRRNRLAQPATRRTGRERNPSAAGTRSPANPSASGTRRPTNRASAREHRERHGRGEQQRLIAGAGPRAAPHVSDRRRRCWRRVGRRGVDPLGGVAGPPPSGVAVHQDDGSCRDRTSADHGHGPQDHAPPDHYRHQAAGPAGPQVRTRSTAVREHRGHRSAGRIDGHRARTPPRAGRRTRPTGDETGASAPALGVIAWRPRRAPDRARRAHDRHRRATVARQQDRRRRPSHGQRSGFARPPGARRTAADGRVSVGSTRALRRSGSHRVRTCGGPPRGRAVAWIPGRAVDGAPAVHRRSRRAARTRRSCRRRGTSCRRARWCAGRRPRRSAGAVVGDARPRWRPGASHGTHP